MDYQECWVRAGQNKMGFKECPGKKLGIKTCEEPVSRPDSNEPGVLWFRFRDTLSAKEYGISALCQTCQDEVFKEPEE